MGILSKDTEALIAMQAAAQGETPDALVRRLLGGEPPHRADVAAMREIVRRHRARPVLDSRPLKELRDELWGS